MKIEFQGISFIVTNPPLQPISIEELSAVETELGCLFPEDYRAFVTTLGAGNIDIGIRAFSPRYILKILSETRERFSENWFWDESPDILTQAKAIECVPCFDSANGDDIIFDPLHRDRWYILPHEEEEVYLVSSFVELCDFYLQLEPQQPRFEFEPDED
ncbi:MAG: SMI1/KNR4 family protein [Prochloraceae cyanobacterium]